MGFFPGIKRAGREFDHSLAHLRLRFRRTGNLRLLPLLGLDRDSFTVPAFSLVVAFAKETTTVKVKESRYRPGVA